MPMPMPMPLPMPMPMPMRMPMQMPLSMQMQMPMTKNSMSSLESKVANAPKKIKNKKAFILGKQDTENLMEDYVE